MSDSKTGGELVDLGSERPKRARGSYQVSPRLRRGLLLLASGEASSIKAAAERVGMTREAISKSLKRDSVRRFMRDEIMASLGITAMKASRALDAILTSGANEMARVSAAKFTLGSAFGIQPPSSGPSTVVNVGGGVGYLIDLRPKGERDLPLTPADAAALAAVREGGGPGVTLHGTRGAARPTGPVVIDGEAVELDGDAK